MSEKKGKVIPRRGVAHEKGTRPNSGKSSMLDLEGKSIRSRAESTGGCVKLKTEI